MTITTVFSSKGDVAYSELRRRILLGDLAAGSRVAQYELAKAMDMSITPIREALRRLSSEGLVELDAHRDVRVAGVSAAEGRELLEIRVAIEPMAVALAAARRTDADLAAMRAAAATLLPVTRQWGEDAIVAHSAFHRAVYLASHNVSMIRLLDDLWAKSDRYRRLGLELPPGNEPRTVDHRQHGEILDLVIAQDAEGAAALTRTHIENSLTGAVLDTLEADTARR